MLELAFAFVLGCVLGVVSGIIPGLNIFVTILLFFPLLMTWEPTTIMFMYITLASVNQYFGSVSATIFALPGSTTSIPALKEGHAMFNNGQGDTAIMHAAIGSFFASIFAVLLIVLCIPFVEIFYQLFNTHVQVVMLVIASITIVAFSQNRFVISLFLFAVGNALAFVGYHEQYAIDFGTFGLTELRTGIPLLPVMIALFVFPIFVKNWNTYQTLEFKGVSIDGYVQSFKNLWPLRATLLRSSIIGSVAGFIPGISWTLSTLLSYNYERIVQIRKGTYDDVKGNLPSLVAAESANNAGIYTAMIPMLFVGVPITASTALIYNILQFKGVVLNSAFFQDLYGIVTIGFVLSSAIGLFIAGKYVNFLTVLQGLNIKWFYTVLFMILIGVCYIAGQSQFFGVESLIILAVLLPFGLLLTKTNSLPLVYGFILHDMLLDSIIRLTYFY